MSRFVYFPVLTFVMLILCVYPTLSVKTVYPLGVNGPVLNPERGFRFQEGLFLSKIQRIVQWCEESNTTVLQLYEPLIDYMGQGIPQTRLNEYNTFFDGMRKAGLKVLLRFYYEVDIAPTRGPTFDDIFRHVDQLAPITRANADVIMALQAGFIGYWGEWHHSFNKLEGNTPMLAKLIHKILYEMLPEDRTMQIRYLNFKYNTLKAGLPGMNWGVISDATAHTPAAFSRIGFHDDHMFHDKHEYTYMDWPIQGKDAEPGNVHFDYVTQESPYVFVDGELPWYSTAVVNGTAAFKRFRQHHFSTFSIVHGYAPYGKRSLRSEMKMERDINTINAWSLMPLNEPASWNFIGMWNVPFSAYYTLWPNTWFDYIRDHLGYRLEVQSVTYTETLTQNGVFNMTVVLKNFGMSPPHSPRPVYLVWINSNNVPVFSLPINVDPRTWQSCVPYDPQFTLLSWEISSTIQIPQNLAAGTYKFGLMLPDMRDTTFSNSRYAIRFANAIPYWTTTNEYRHGGWGVNIFGDVTVTPLPAGVLTSVLGVLIQITRSPQPVTVTEGNTATFSVAATGPQPLSFQWLKDGIPIPGKTSSTYTTGPLSVSDSFSLYACAISSASAATVVSSSALLKVTYSVSVPPTVTISSPANETIYQAGNVITFSGAASDIQDGAVAGSSLSWTVSFTDVAAGTETRVMGPVSGSSGRFTVPVENRAGPHQYFTISLTAVNSLGLRSTSSIIIRPELVYVVLRANLAGLRFQVAVDGKMASLPYTFTGVVGSKRQISAVSKVQSIDGSNYTFMSWSNGGYLEHDITVPGKTTSYMAVFQRRISVIYSNQFKDHVLTVNGPVAAGSTLVFSLLANGVPTSAQQFEFTQDGFIQNVANPGLVVGLRTTPAASGTAVVLVNKFTNTALSNKWQLHAFGDSDYKYIQNKESNGYAFEICTTGCDGYQVLIRSKSVASTKQLFWYRPVAEDEYLVIRNKESGATLTASSATTNAAILSQPFTGIGAAPLPTQQWLWNAESGLLSLYSKQDLVIGVPGAISEAVPAGLVNITQPPNAYSTWSVATGSVGLIFRNQVQFQGRTLALDLNQMRGTTVVMKTAWGLPWTQQWVVERRPIHPNVFA